MPNSNAIAIVTVQDQDLVTSTQPILAQRLSATVTFPSSNVLQFGGFVNVVSAGFTNLFVNQNVAFVYIRNASTSTNSTLFLQITPNGGALFTTNLSPGGIFLVANSISTTGNSYQTISYAATVGAPAVMEYVYAT